VHVSNRCPDMQGYQEIRACGNLGAIGKVGDARVRAHWARSPLWLRLGGMLAVAGDLLSVIGAALLIVVTDVLTRPGR
jgi:hypothetical protein